MKKTMIAAVNIALIAVGWFALSWLFFNSMAVGAQNRTSPGLAAAYGSHDAGGCVNAASDPE